jgi:membrane protease YdiL (CAAX protease family)
MGTGETDETTGTSQHRAEANRWQEFWGKGGFWRALLVMVIYAVPYLGTGRLVGILFSDAIDPDDTLASPTSVFLAYVLPLAVGTVVLLVFAATLGWNRRLFSRQAIGGSWWMWILPAVVLAANALRYATVDYGAFVAGVVPMLLLVGVFVGLAEEILSRGFFVTMLRDGGHRELVVALVSSLMFAGLHLINLLSGASLFEVLFLLVYTFSFGVAMYLTLRVTRHLIWPIVLHATTDPATFLYNEHPADLGLTDVAAQSNWPVIFLGLALVWFVRGRVASGAQRASEAAPAVGRGQG